MPIKQILADRPMFTVDKEMSVQAAVEYMAEKNIGAVPVMEGSRLVGIFSERDVLNRVIARQLSPATTSVASVMTSNLVVAEADESNESCLRKMKQANCRHLPVVEGERLVGVISVRDLMQVEISEATDKIEFLHNYMFHVSSVLEKKYAR